MEKNQEIFRVSRFVFVVSAMIIATNAAFSVYSSSQQDNIGDELNCQTACAVADDFSFGK